MILVFASCKFPELPPLETDADVGTDADAAIDAGPPECSAGLQSCIAGALTQCGADSRYMRYGVPNGGPAGEAITVTMHDYPCPLGCHASEPRCADVAPSNGLIGAMDSVNVSLTGLDVVLDDASGDILVSTNNGAPNGELVFVESGGTQIPVPADVVTQSNGVDIVVLKVRSFTLGLGVHLKLAGTKAVAIASHLDVYIDGHLDLSGTTIGAGPSTNTACNVAFAPGAGGGGGNYENGGNASSGAAGGSHMQSASLVPLEGGCSNYLGVGGRAIQIVSRTRVALSPTGIINVSGRQGNGLFGSGVLYAFGGGSGGAGLVESPSIVLALGSRIAGRGGSGAAANGANNTFASGTAGDADLASTSVPGATCSGCGTGGNGGTESTPPTAGTGISGSTLGGGGGSVGRCVVTNRSGILLPPSGTMKVRYTPRVLATR